MARKINSNLIMLFIILLAALSCGPSGEEKSDKVLYLDPGQPVEERVADLLGRMTIEEKIGQMNQYLAPRYAKASEPADFSGRDLEGLDLSLHDERAYNH